MDDDMPGRKKNKKKKKQLKKEKIKRSTMKKQYKVKYSDEEEDIFKDDDMKYEYNEKSESGEEKDGDKNVSDIWLKMLQNTTSA
jgi:hypothetical protein